VNHDELKKTADQVREITVFCLERKGRCFNGWNPAKVFRWFCYHYLNGTLFTVIQDGSLKAIGCAWRACRSDIEGKNLDKLPPFDWTPTNRTGDATVIGQVFGDKHTCYELWAAVCKKWPESKSQPVFTWRNRKIHRLKKEVVERFSGGKVVMG